MGKTERHSTSITQTGDIEKFLFLWEDGRIKMQLWLRCCPVPSVILDLDVKDAMNIKEALDCILKICEGNSKTS